MIKERTEKYFNGYYTSMRSELTEKKNKLLCNF